jgi:hypothetical protein
MRWNVGFWQILLRKSAMRLAGAASATVFFCRSLRLERWLDASPRDARSCGFPDLERSLFRPCDFLTTQRRRCKARRVINHLSRARLTVGGGIRIGSTATRLTVWGPRDGCREKTEWHSVVIFNENLCRWPSST